MYILLAQKERLNTCSSPVQHPAEFVPSHFCGSYSGFKKHRYRCEEGKWVKKVATKGNANGNMKRYGAKPRSSKGNTEEEKKEKKGQADLQRTAERLQSMRERLGLKPSKYSENLAGENPSETNCLAGSLEASSSIVKSMDEEVGEELMTTSTAEESQIITTAIADAMAEASGNELRKDDFNLNRRGPNAANVSLSFPSDSFKASFADSTKETADTISAGSQKEFSAEGSKNYTPVCPTSPFYSDEVYHASKYMLLDDSVWEDSCTNEIKEGLDSLDSISELRIGKGRQMALAELECFKPFYNNNLLKKCRLSLQRPKKKPLHEYYIDDDAELEGTCLYIP
ncbi:unnamed protein product [Enterobius vermicularis]|uniref:Dentin sialophosphoprotein-like n=1 Tax=Enterobius vermicularis TaxID=51028 RepID=A0A0N4UZZ8_ENTVE|nr:unnamed protein product [Enterobius vermicularis]